MAKTKAPKKPKGDRPKQGHLPDMAPVKIPEIERAADEFVAARNAWQRCHQPMMEAKAVLMHLMKKHGIKTYDYDDEIVELIDKENVTVKKKKDDSNGEV